LAISCVRICWPALLHQFYDAGQEAVRARMFDLDRTRLLKASTNCRNLPGCMAAHGRTNSLSQRDRDFNPYYACAQVRQVVLVRRCGREKNEIRP
jgi:hypothetical protein